MTTMLRTIALVCVYLISTQARPQVDATMVQGCQLCHRGATSLAEQPLEDLVARISSMTSGEIAHPVPLPSLSAEDIEALAQALRE